MCPSATGELQPAEPVSTFLHVGPEVIHPKDLYARAACAEAGAVAQFCGTVRNHNQGAQVVEIEYEAYVDMAQDVLRTILTEVFERWPYWSASVVHRTGRLAIGDVSVCVTVSASHRDFAFAACRAVIDRLKSRAPIWKRETLQSGDRRWLEESTPPGASAENA